MIKAMVMMWILAPLDGIGVTYGNINLIVKIKERKNIKRYKGNFYQKRYLVLIILILLIREVSTFFILIQVNSSSNELDRRRGDITKLRFGLLFLGARRDEIV